MGNPNVRLSIAFTFLMAFSAGAYGYTVLSGYLRELSNSNTSVGFAEGLQGMANVVVALPAGYLADRYSRSAILRVSSVLGLLSSGFFTVALFAGTSAETEYKLAAAALVLVGMFNGTRSSPLESLYADSVTVDQRARLTSFKFAARLVGASSGSFMSILISHFNGDAWTLPEVCIEVFEQ